MGKHSNTTDEFWQRVTLMLQRELAAKKFSVRLIGVGVSNFEPYPTTQTDLFSVDEAKKQQHLDEIADKIRNRYGKSTIRRGRGLG